MQWLNNNHQYKQKIENNLYAFIDIHDKKRYNMILKTKNDILDWLKNYDRCYNRNDENKAKMDYQIIDMYDNNQEILLKSFIEKYRLPENYFEILKSKEHRFIINIHREFDISSNALTYIPIKIFNVNGSFQCSHNELTLFHNFPDFIIGYLDCSNNRLKSLKDCPISITGDFDCSYNQLNSLEYFPKFIKREIYFNNNLLLLKYRNESNDIYIKNMLDDYFFNQRKFSFWHKLHLETKSIQENNEIINRLDLDNTFNEVLFQIKVKKV